MQGSEQQRQRQGSWSPHKKSPNWQRQTWYIHSDTVLIEGKEAEEVAFSSSQVLQDFRQYLGSISCILLNGKVLHTLNERSF